MLMWFKDGRLREYEAWSCMDVDSVHNDYQRHLLYLWGFPDFELQKMDAWSSWAQRVDGSVWESLGYKGQPMDVVGGRTMGDTTSLYLVEMYELYRNTGNRSLVASRWPSAKRATAWMIGNAMRSGHGLPQFLSNTYDHFGFEHRRFAAYNAHIYLTALRAATELADLVGDVNVSQQARDALELGASRLLQPREAHGWLWNESAAYWHAHSETDSQIMTDTLFGQMLSHHVVQNFTLPRAQLSSHLTREWRRNQDTYGMRVTNDPIQEDAIWMNGPPTWTYLQLTLGELTAEAAFEPFKRMSENFRSRLADMWNLRALTHTDGSGASPSTTRPIELGAPYEQGHYGFMLTDLFLLPLLSGQVVNLGSQAVQLSFEPRFPPPYTLPLLLVNCEGTISAAANGTVTVAVAFGRLQLHAGGLSVHGRLYPKAVTLRSGQSVSW